MVREREKRKIIGNERGKLKILLLRDRQREKTEWTLFLARGKENYENERGETVKYRCLEKEQREKTIGQKS